MTALLALALVRPALQTEALDAVLGPLSRSGPIVKIEVVPISSPSPSTGKPRVATGAKDPGPKNPGPKNPGPKNAPKAAAHSSVSKRVVKVVAAPRTSARILELEAKVAALRSVLLSEQDDNRELVEKLRSVARLYVASSEAAQRQISGLSVRVDNLTAAQDSQVTGSFTVMVDAPAVLAGFANEMVSADRCLVAVDANGSDGATLNTSASVALRKSGFRVFDAGYLSRAGDLSRASLKPAVDETLAGLVVLIDRVKVEPSQVNYGLISHRGSCRLRLVYSGTGELAADPKILNAKGFGGDDSQAKQNALDSLSESLGEWVLTNVRGSPQIPTRRMNVVFRDSDELDRSVALLQGIPSVRNVQVVGGGRARSIVVSASDRGWPAAAALGVAAAERGQELELQGTNR